MNLREFAAIAALKRGDPGPAIELLRGEGSISAALRQALVNYLEHPPRRVGKPAKTAFEKLAATITADELKNMVKERTEELGSRERALQSVAEVLHISPEAVSDRLYRPNRKRTRT